MNAVVQPTHGTFAEMIQAVVALGRNGHFDERLRRSAAASGISEGGASAGGFLVPADATQRIWTRAYNTSRIIARCSKQPVTRSSGVIIPIVDESSRADGARSGSMRMYWVDEGEAPSASRPKLGGFQLIPRKLLGVVYATDELVQDVPGLAEFLERELAREAAFAIEDRIINGTGASSVAGILNSGALIVVAKEAAQASLSVTYNNLATMSKRLWAPSHRSAIWLMGNDAYGEILNLVTPGGDDVITTGADGAEYMFGMPIELTEYTPPLGQKGDIMLCDLGQYLLAEAGGQVDSSIHVQFVTDETAFRFRTRADGHPGWSAPVVPKNSTNTQSPFIALAARP